MSKRELTESEYQGLIEMCRNLKALLQVGCAGLETMEMLLESEVPKDKLN